MHSIQNSTILQQHTHQQFPSIVTLSEIEEVVSSKKFALDLIESIKDGFMSYSNGKFNACPIQTMGAPPMAPFGGGSSSSSSSNYAAQTCVKSGYLTGESHYIIKVASGGYPFPNSGLMQLFSQYTGKLEMILLDDGLLTELRTAAAGAVAAQLLAPELTKSSYIGILGTGVQARYQLRYLQYVTKCRNVLVYGRTEKHVSKFITGMESESEGWDIKSVNDPDNLLEHCQLIVTTTSSREPILGKSYDWGSDKLPKRPLHITAMGSDATGKRELSESLIRAADLLVTDSRIQTKERGEFEDVLNNGVVNMDDIVEIGELATRNELHRRKDSSNGEDCRLTIFDTSGVSVQDCIIAMMVNAALK